MAEANLRVRRDEHRSAPSGCLLADRSATLDPGETCGDALLLVPKDAIRLPTTAAQMPTNRSMAAPRYASLCDPWCVQGWARNAKPDADRCYPRSPSEARGSTLAPDGPANQSGWPKTRPLMAPLCLR